jgi:TfoX/Sxy family transcriptional regulator of competence genes
MLPENVFHDPTELRQWIARAFEFAATLPKKAKSAAKKPAAKKPAAKKPAAKKSAT